MWKVGVSVRLAHIEGATRKVANVLHDKMILQPKGWSLQDGGWVGIAKYAVHFRDEDDPNRGNRCG